MTTFSTRPMHVNATEFNAIFWFADNAYYSELPIYSNENGDPAIKTISGVHILYNEDRIVEFPNKEHMVLKPEEFTHLYFKILPYS